MFSIRSWSLESPQSLFFWGCTVWVQTIPPPLLDPHLGCSVFFLEACSILSCPMPAAASLEVLA